ncbi:MAG TPA: metal-dependent transcriptional regulator [Candidatus Eisenbacteria bacterium]|jgi:DtxR family Mn-dependent transcriptional regulator|nr:metal-dependent transcriptional regulator [Candidatus Eisenbacteria bacterium]
METWKRFHEKQLTHSMAHYLQAIAALMRAPGGASVSAIAERLTVSKAGVTSMIRTLKSRGLAEHEPYGDVRLTAEGLRLATRTERSRDVLTEFFGEILGLDSDTAAEDACMIEHLVSPDSMVRFLRLTAFLRSSDPAAMKFRAEFRDYQNRCESGVESEGCPVCHGRCLRAMLDELDPAPETTLNQEESGS